VNSVVRILHLEDDPGDSQLIEATLKAEAGACEMTRVETEQEFCAALEQDGFQLILADYTLPSFDGISALKIAVEKRPEVPFIFVSGTLDEEVAIESLKLGATDYVFKTRLSRIFPAVQRALREGGERAERKRAEALLAGEKRLLELIATGVALKEILNALCLVIEEDRSGALASVLLLNEDGLHLDCVASPHLPEQWARQMESLPIGPCAGSCGTAAYRGSAVIVSDVAIDPLWNIPVHRELALKHGLRASWSNPILSSQAQVLGTFCIYYREPRTPDSRDFAVNEMATHLARVAIEGERAEEALRRSERFLAEGQRISLTGSWGWNLRTGKIVWSCEQARMLGFDLSTEPSVELFLNRVHPEDRDRIRQALDQATSVGSEYEIQYRVVLSNDVIRYFISVGRPVRKQSVDVDEYIGITVDVTESKQAENALRASEQVARGQVEALVQSLDVLTTAPPAEDFIGEMLSTIGRLLDAQSVVLWSFEDATDELVLRAGARDTDLAAIGCGHPFVRDGRSWKQSPRVRHMLVTGVPAASEDIENDPQLSAGLREYFSGSRTKKFLMIPTLIKGRVKGFIGIRHGDRAPYRPEEIELAQALAHQAMFAIQLNELAEKGRQAAVLEERNRVARDIHDTIAQGLIGVIVQLQAAGDATSKGYKKQARDHLQNASTLARDSLNEARRSVFALRPQALEKATFWEALQRLVKNATAGTELRTEFRTQGKARDLSPKVEENLLHIGQEALTNALKYAHATRFDVRLSFKANEIRLELEDNGSGFDAQERQDGFGLKGMRERAEQMGGTFKLNSARTKGTKILVASPYAKVESPIQSSSATKAA
jgi:signal transduction histidine kinase/DNA-binding response OmpR family regulator